MRSVVKLWIHLGQIEESSEFPRWNGPPFQINFVIVDASKQTSVEKCSECEYIYIYMNLSNGFTTEVQSKYDWNDFTEWCLRKVLGLKTSHRLISWVNCNMLLRFPWNLKGYFPSPAPPHLGKKTISFTTSRSTKDPKLLPETWTFRLREKLTGLGNPIPNKNPCFSWLIFEEMTT